MNIEEKKEQFEHWLAHMDDALDSFLSEIACTLDYSIESLEQLENHLLQDFSTIEVARAQDSAIKLDGYSRYLGEVIRKTIGGTWSISYDDPKNAFYGRPQIINCKGQTSQICPQALVTASIDRRRGDFLKTLVVNWAQRI